jgi:hypothetical protein
VKKLPKFDDQNIDLPYGIPIQKGLVDNFTSTGQFGYNTAVSTTFATVWGGTGLYVYPTSASTAVAISSNTVSDDGGTVLLTGLDETYTEASEVITIGGSASTTTFIRVFSARMITANTGDANVGNITITADSKTVAYINAGYGSSLQAVYTVPVNKKAWIISASIGMSKQKEIESKIMVKQINNGNVWNTIGYQTTFAVPLYRKFEMPIPILEKSDIELRAKADATCAVSGSFEILLEDVTYST